MKTSVQPAIEVKLPTNLALDFSLYEKEGLSRGQLVLAQKSGYLVVSKKRLQSRVRVFIGGS